VPLWKRPGTTRGFRPLNGRSVELGRLLEVAVEAARHIAPTLDITIVAASAVAAARLRGRDSEESSARAGSLPGDIQLDDTDPMPEQGRARAEIVPSRVTCPWL